MISQFRRDNCDIISVPPCDGPENFAEALRLATGEFVFILGDDDIYFDRAIDAMPCLIDQVGKDPAVAGLSGTYAVEYSKGTALVSYSGIDSDDVAARISGYLGYGGANVLIYSPLRRSVIEQVFHFTQQMPFFCTFHDQIICLLYLLNGKFVKLQRLIYAYDAGPWEEPASAQKRDAESYCVAGLDPAINKLHWFMCGFEGAVLIRNGDVFPDHSAEQRQKMADQWFSVMFMRFMHNPRLTFDSPFTAQADALCGKLRASQGRLSFADMLADICRFMALFSEAKAQNYLRFWAEALKPKKQAVASA